MEVIRLMKMKIKREKKVMNVFLEVIQQCRGAVLSIIRKLKMIHRFCSL